MPENRYQTTDSNAATPRPPTDIPDIITTPRSPVGNSDAKPYFLKAIIFLM
jgi:hypothetical protein